MDLRKMSEKDIEENLKEILDKESRVSLQKCVIRI